MQKGLTCQIRITLAAQGSRVETFASHSSESVLGKHWLAQKLAEDGNEASVPPIWTKHMFPSQRSSELCEEFEDKNDEDEDRTYKEIEGENRWTVPIDKPVKVEPGSEEQSQEDMLTFWTAQGYKLGLPVVSLDDLIDKKFSEDRIRTHKSKKTDRSVNNSLDPWLKSFSFTCDKCGQKFDMKETCNEHTIKCTQKEVKCILCNETFSSVPELNDHMKAVHRAFRYSCNMCSVQFTRKKELIRHYCTAHDERPYQCGKCEKKFESEDNLTLHMTSHDIKKGYSCSECAKAFRNPAKLRMHMKIHTNMEKPYKCEQCGSAFLLKHNLGQHIKRVHEVALMCRLCGVSIKGAIASLRLHMLHVHGQKYKYKCEVCDQEFEAQYEVRAHRRSHSTSFQCNLCGKMFTNKRSYLQHMERHSGIAKYECIECNRMFMTREARCKHMVTHRASRNFHCDVCGKSFKSYTVLKRHQEIHENKRKYKCKLCGKGFNSSGSIVKHRAVHEKEGIKDVAMYCNAKLS